MTEAIRAVLDLINVVLMKGIAIMMVNAKVILCVDLIIAMAQDSRPVMTVANENVPWFGLTIFRIFRISGN